MLSGLPRASPGSPRSAQLFASGSARQLYAVHRGWSVHSMQQPRAARAVAWPIGAPPKLVAVCKVPAETVTTHRHMPAPRGLAAQGQVPAKNKGLTPETY